MNFSGVKDAFRTRALELFYPDDFSSMNQDDVKNDFEIFMQMPYTD